MNEKPSYYDVRAEFWREHFEKALEYSRFLDSSEPVHAAKWKALSERIPPLSEKERKRLQGYNRPMKILVYCSAWCGDCARQMPMIQSIASAAGPQLEVRLVDRDASEALQDELRILGALRVPVVVFLSEDFYEVGRFGDRMLVTYRRKLKEHIVQACDTGLVPPPPEELAAELGEWMNIFERMLHMVRLSPPLCERHKD